MIQNHRDALQKLRVDAVFLEYSVHRGTVAPNLACEPTDAAFLPFQLIFINKPIDNIRSLC